MKILVAHPAQQHSYRLAVALKQCNCLFKYATTVYLGNKSFTKFIIPFLPKKYQNKAKGRICEALEDIDILQFCEIEGLFRILIQNVPLFRRYHNNVRYHVADRFAKKVARYAIRNKIDVVITYDDCSPILFEILKKKAPQIKRILDTSAANRLYMKGIYEKDTILVPHYAAKLQKEVPQVWNRAILERVQREIQSANYFLVPSTFVARSLAFSGISEKQILKCPYGVDINQFQMKAFESELMNLQMCNSSEVQHKPVKFVFIGGTKELKGIFWLLEAFREIGNDNAILTVIGGVSISEQEQNNYPNVIFSGFLNHSSIPEVLRKSDVFIMPSLGEGLSLSVLEAAACGLPLIISENSGANDLITDGVEGFVIPIQSSHSIEEKVRWFINNRDKIPQMGQKARLMAENMSWETYYSQVKSIIQKLEI